MTVSSQDSDITFSAGPATVFSLPFRFFDNDEIYVSKIEIATDTVTPMVEGTDYTLAGAGEPEVDGNAASVMTLAAPIATGFQVYVQRTLAEEQQTDIINQGKFFPEIHENVFDRLVMLIQQLSRGLTGALRQVTGGFAWDALTLRIINLGTPVNGTDAATKDYVDTQGAGNLSRTLRVNAPETLNALGNAAARANKVLSFDGSGQPSLLTPSTDNVTTYAALLAGDSGSANIGYKFPDANSVHRTVQDKLTETISPLDFGAVGDGVTNDGSALNKMLAYMRARIDAAAGNNTIIRADLAGRTYRTTVSLNATALRSGWEVCNGTIIGACTGKAVIDAIGSRDGRWSNLMVLGDKTNMPTTGMQCARAAAPYGFCDGVIYDHVRIRGYFSIAALYAYAQEGTLHLHCKYWNSNPDAYIACLIGYDSVVVSSDYLAPVTGAQSFINDKYLNTDFLHLPEGGQAAITGISKANPAVVTAPGHPFVNGQTVSIGYVNGMGQINNKVGTVAGATANTFQLSGVDSTSYGTYTSGGAATRSQSKPSVLMNRCQQHDFDTCYIVNYGSDCIEMNFPDGFPLETVNLGILCEGTGTRSILRFTQAGTITGFKLDTYNITCRDAIISTSIGAGNIALTNADIDLENVVWAQTPALFSDNARFSLYGCDVAYASAVTFSPSSLFDRLSGTVKNLSSSVVTHYNAEIGSSKDGSSSPGITTAGGALGAYTATLNIKYNGKRAFFTLRINITSVGAGSGGIIVTMPFTTADIVSSMGDEFGVSGTTIRGMMPSGSSSLTILKFDGTTAIVAGGNYRLTGWADTV